MIITYEHHGKQTHVEEQLKGRHREHCLCYKGCLRFLPGSDYNCSIAESLLAFDKEHGVVTPVWECEGFLPDGKEDK